MKGKRRTKIWIATLLALLPAASTAQTATAATPGTLDLHALNRLSWHGGRYEVASGESVKVVVSAAYASDTGAGQRWADFFASLVHGPELSLLTAYVAPLDEVQELCDGTDVLGCYEGNRLVVIGEPAYGISPQSVAAHEYGHHVAYNRVNLPWAAIDWGTKRWATYENICARTASLTAFPGDEGLMYSLNPGEAFAESFRVLNGYAPDDWPIVDPSFRPDPTALSLLREDVLDPWTQPPARTISGRFQGSQAWTLLLQTPLDGELVARITPGADDLTLAGADTKTVLALGSWSTGGAKAIDYRVCGRRTILLRVTRHGPSRRFVLRLSTP
jgi:hypothetical protein